MMHDPRFTVLFLILTILANAFAGVSALASDASLDPGTRTAFIVLGVIGGAISGTLSACGISAKSAPPSSAAPRSLFGLGDGGRDIAVTVGVQAFLAALKSPDARRKFRSISLQVYRQLRMVFAGDPDFS
jgi:hypothetical protein